MAIIEKGKCQIDYLNDKGIGVGRTNYGNVELTYTIPGEIVSFDRHLYRGKTNCQLSSIVISSPSRVKAPCQYFGTCGGCLLQHLDEEEYLRFKQGIIEKELATENINTIIKPIRIIPPGLRRRANLQVLKKNEQIFLGFYRFHSHQIINVTQCIALLPELSEVILPLKDLLLHILFGKSKAEIFLTKASNGIDLEIELKEEIKLTIEQKRTIENFAHKHGFIRIVISYQNQIETIHKVSHPFIMFDDIAVDIEARSFLQASSLSEQVLTEVVLNYLPLDNGGKVIDLFCGRGTFTVPLSRYFSVHGFEVDSEAVNALGRAISKGRNQVKLFLRDLFLTPVSSSELVGYDFAVINPPRQGAKLQCHELAKTHIERIIYVSCNTQSFVKDAKILINKGYRLKEVTPVDQFFWSPHLEVVGFFYK